MKPSKKTTISTQIAPAAPASAAAQRMPTIDYVIEADFDDTVAKNRGLPLIDPSSVPRPPAGFRPTDAETRSRRLRKLSFELRAEAVNALLEAAELDLRADLGRYAPDPKRAPLLAERLERTVRLSTAVQGLLLYAREMEQIAMNDALLFLEAEHKQLAHVLEHAPELAEKYAALRTVFETRAASIVEGRARAAKEAAVTAPPPEQARPVA